MTWLRPDSMKNSAQRMVFFEIYFVRLSGFSFN